MKRLIAAVNRCATQNQNFSANCEARLWEVDCGTTEVAPSRRSITARLKSCPPVRPIAPRGQECPRYRLPRRPAPPRSHQALLPLAINNLRTECSRSQSAVVIVDGGRLAPDMKSKNCSELPRPVGSQAATVLSFGWDRRQTVGDLIDNLVTIVFVIFV